MVYLPTTTTSAADREKVKGKVQWGATKEKISLGANISAKASDAFERQQLKDVEDRKREDEELATRERLALAQREAERRAQAEYEAAEAEFERAKALEEEALAVEAARNAEIARNKIVGGVAVIYESMRFTRKLEGVLVESREEAAAKEAKMFEEREARKKAMREAAKGKAQWSATKEKVGTAAGVAIEAKDALKRKEATDAENENAKKAMADLEMLLAGGFVVSVVNETTASHLKDHDDLGAPPRRSSKELSTKDLRCVDAYEAMEHDRLIMMPLGSTQT